MKDFPIFTTEYGVASLILKEVPYRQEAYIRIRDSLELEKLLEECVSFCRICGAEKIYAAGHPSLERFALHTTILRMQGNVPFAPESLPQLWPVTQDNVETWCSIHNQKMRRIPNAGTLEKRDETEILNSGGAYFVHDNGVLLGIGWRREKELALVASMRPGAGKRICEAMQSLNPEENMVLEVASTNTKAMELYAQLGFVQTAEISKWYTVKNKEDVSRNNT